ncbi:hypothetical protein HZC00_05645 [Candidatus Kaiserbacteria bacterium]|nr:hypothetical protein [Candidatus Kaiserbacteria bacterium]
MYDFSAASKLIRFLEEGNLQGIADVVISGNRAEFRLLSRYKGSDERWSFSETDGCPSMKCSLRGRIGKSSLEYQILRQWAESQELKIVRKCNYSSQSLRSQFFWGRLVECREAFVIRPSWKLRLRRMFRSADQLLA